MPNNTGGGSIVCAGLSCLDLQLLGCTRSGTDEAIERYDEAVHCAGGSASMTGTTLALLLRRRRRPSTSTEEEGEDDEGGEEEVHVLTKIGSDFAGDTLSSFYTRAGASTDLVLRDDDARTSMAVLPVFNDGKRGCFVNLACNDGFTPEELLGRLENGAATMAGPTRAFLFGYPHLMPKMQGDSLRSMLREARRMLSSSGGENPTLVGVDLNGVDGSDPGAAREALYPALGEIDVLHLNEDEAAVLSSPSEPPGENDGDAVATEDDVSPGMLSQIASFHEEGCAVVLLSLGSRGALVSVTPDAERLRRSSPDGCDAALGRWTPGTRVRVPAFRVPHGEVNANGAGDALFSGFCLAASSWWVRAAAGRRPGDAGGEGWEVTPCAAGTFASLVAWQRCDARTRDGDGMRSAAELMELVRRGNLPDALEP